MHVCVCAVVSSALIAQGTAGLMYLWCTPSVPNSVCFKNTSSEFTFTPSQLAVNSSVPGRQCQCPVHGQPAVAGASQLRGFQTNIALHTDSCGVHHRPGGREPGRAALRAAGADAVPDLSRAAACGLEPDAAGPDGDGCVLPAGRHALASE